MAAPPKSTRPAGVLAVTDTRVAALRICEELRTGTMLDLAFERYASRLDARNRRWLQQLVFGMLRQRARLDAIIAARVTGGSARLNPTLLDLLRLGSYQLLHMGGVPAYAAIAQTVELAKHQHGVGAGSLVNAVLRRIDRERDALSFPPVSDPAEALALEYSHPLWIVNRWIERFGLAETNALLQSNNTEPVLHVRASTWSNDELHAELTRAHALGGVHPLLGDGARLEHGVALTELGAFKRGLMFVQDPAATLVARYAAFPEGSIVADLCSAPGGKAMEIAQRNVTVLAGDRSFPRVGRVDQNIRRIKADNIHAFVGDAMAPPLRSAESILIDVPCTGTGTFRRHPDARWRMKISDIAVMAQFQRDLLRNAAELLAPGGILVYSTCSLEPEENEDQISALLAERSDLVLEPPPEGTVPAEVLDGGMLRVLPHKHGVDGAFAARIRKLA